MRWPAVALLAALLGALLWVASPASAAPDEGPGPGPGASPGGPPGRWECPLCDRPGPRGDGPGRWMRGPGGPGRGPWWTARDGGADVRPGPMRRLRMRKQDGGPMGPGDRARCDGSGPGPRLRGMAWRARMRARMQDRMGPSGPADDGRPGRRGGWMRERMGPGGPGRGPGFRGPGPGAGRGPGPGMGRGAGGMRPDTGRFMMRLDLGPEQQKVWRSAQQELREDVQEQVRRVLASLTKEQHEMLRAGGAGPGAKEPLTVRVARLLLTSPQGPKARPGEAPRKDRVPTEERRRKKERQDRDDED